MTIHCTAVYENGVLRPRKPIELAEGSEVELAIVPLATASQPIRRHGAFLNGYAPEDESLYDDLPP